MSKFAKEDRITIPGVHAEGVVLDITETVPGFPVYDVRWLDLAGETHTGKLGEGDLSSVNKTDAEMLTEAQAEKRADDEIDAEIERRAKSLAEARRRNAKLRTKKKASTKRKR